MLPVEVTLFSCDGKAILIVLPRGLWMTSCFHIVDQNGPESKTMLVFRPDRRVTAPEAKSAVCDCNLPSGPVVKALRLHVQ